MPHEEAIYTDLAAAYVRGRLAGLTQSDPNRLIDLGRDAGLRLHRFKRTEQLPRVRAVIGILRGLVVETLLDIGSGRGVFLWPLLDAFPTLRVDATDLDPRRVDHIAAVSRGGVQRLRAHCLNAAFLPFDNDSFDAVTILEVLEHADDPATVAAEACRAARRFIIASVPSHSDENPEHLRLFTRHDLERLLLDAGATKANVQYVRGHMIAVARVV